MQPRRAGVHGRNSPERWPPWPDPVWWSTRYESAGWGWRPVQRAAYAAGMSTEAGVRPSGVVVDAPVADHDLGFEERVEPFTLQQLVACAAVEALDERVCHGLPGSMKITPTPEVRHQSATA